MLLGQVFTLKVVPEPARVGIQESNLIVGVTPSSEAHVSRRVLEWLHDQALLCFEERVAYYRDLIGAKPAPKVFLSSARTRWGSCHSSGRIHLNWRLVQMPPHLIDYVVAHEVAHLLEMNHSHRFWRTVERLVPDYAARRKELRREGHRYLLI
jgi:predicted metal-dependent hydrolase